MNNGERSWGEWFTLGAGVVAMAFVAYRLGQHAAYRDMLHRLYSIKDERAHHSNYTDPIIKGRN